MHSNRRPLTLFMKKLKTITSKSKVTNYSHTSVYPYYLISLLYIYYSIISFLLSHIALSDSSSCVGNIKDTPL